MWTTSVMCGWCHTMVVAPADGSRATCPACGHDAGRPRLECECPSCRRPAPAAAERDECPDGSTRRGGW